MVSELQPLIDKVWRHCDEKGLRGRTVTLKVKFSDFEIITRSGSVPVAVSSRSDLERLAVALLQNEIPSPKPIRLLGVSLRCRGRTSRSRNSDFRSEEHSGRRRDATLSDSLVSPY
jgi:nucleotidyltransferase/DNA polymerase involved in DNA repair